MLLFVTLLHIILCFVLMLVILLQPGKGSDVGAAFGGGGGSSIFGPRGAGSFLSQATTIVAILFMFSSIYLAWNSSASARSDSNVEDAMKRLSRERIEGDVYQVPAEGIGAGVPAEPTPAPLGPVDESTGGEAGAEPPPTDVGGGVQPTPGPLDGTPTPAETPPAPATE